MQAATTFYSRPVLEAIEEGTVYSDLLCNEPLVSEHGDIHKLVAAIQKLVALGAITLEPHWIPEDGDDFKVRLTKRGRFLRSYSCDD